MLRGVDLKNKNRPTGDSALNRASQEALEHNVVSHILGALVLLGCEIMQHPQQALPAPKQTEQRAQRKPATDSIGSAHRKLLDVVGVGTAIKPAMSKYRSTHATVEAEGIRYNGNLYKSLSAAAKAVTGYRTINGRLFWGVEGENGKVTKFADILSGTPVPRPQSEHQTTAVTVAKGPTRNPIARVGRVHRKLLDIVGVGTVIKPAMPKYRRNHATVEATGIRYDGKLYTSPQQRRRPSQDTALSTAGRFGALRASPAS